MVTTNQKSLVYKRYIKAKRKDFKHYTAESHQHTREESKIIRKKQRTTKTIRKQVIKYSEITNAFQ